jgi:hypothetical protein
MDGKEHDKSIIEKTIEAVKEIATIASDAAKKAIEPEPLKPGDRVVMVPIMDSGLTSEPVMPPFVVLPRRKSRAKKASKRTAKKAAKKSIKRSAKNSSKKKKAARAWKPTAKAVSKKNTAKRVAKKKEKVEALVVG